MRTPLPTTKMCKTPNCRAWSWELAQGKPCPYCLRVDRMARVWVWVDRIMFVGALAAIAGLVYLSGVL